LLKRFQRMSMFSAMILCLLLILLTACSSTPTNSGVQATSTPTGSQSTPASVTATNGTQGDNGGSSGMPQTATSCPAANTARAAVMRPLALGSHQNLVYIYNDVPPNTSTSSGLLRRYDTATGQKVDIATSGLRIDQAQVSRDGQWVLFLSIPDPRGDSQHSAMLQLVRMDGQGLQTLYCFPNVTYSGHGNASRLPISIQWSEDQKSILVSVNTNNNTSQIFLVDVTSGSICQLFLDKNDSLYSYSVVTWLDYTHFYIIKQGNSAPTPPATVFLMNASTATVANPGLVNILTTDTRMSYFSLDSSPDGRQLYNSYCLLAASPFSTTIKAGPATGGVRTTFFQGTPQDCVQVLRVISSSKLLMLAQVSTEAGNSFTNSVWTMNTTPGASENVLTLLSASPGNQTRYDMNETTQFSWSNISRDGNSYALQAVNPATNTQSILIGSLSGGNAKVIATTNSGMSTVSLAGWTTM
jgi:hypothetical protein